jgi:hypothetical protein
MSLKYKPVTKPDDGTMDLIRRSGSQDPSVSHAAMVELAKALTEPLRQGVLVGDVVTDIFERKILEPGATPEFPLDFLAPGEETQHVAYTNPGNGRIPDRFIEGDFVMVPTYSIANSINWLLKHAREARYDIVARAMQIMKAGFVKKINDDGWHTLISAAADRNILIFDADATAGQFTKRLVSLMKVIMRRNGGGNTASIKQGRLTDLYGSPELLEDIRNWGLDQIDDETRRDVWLSPDGDVKTVFGVDIHDLVEFGENQEYQTYFTGQLGASLNTGDLELVIGIDRLNQDSFLMPVKQEVEIFPDPVLHRSQQGGVYGWMEAGFACLDGRRIIAGSF